MNKLLLVLLIYFLQVQISPQWQMLNGPYETSGVECLLQHPNGSLFAAGTGYQQSYYAIYRSDDSGKTWIRLIQFTSSFDPIRCLVPGIQNEVYAGSWDKYYYSSDNGNNWASRSLHQTLSINSIVFNSSMNIFLCGAEGIYRSTNNGTNWNQVFTGISTDILVDINDNLYTSTTSGIFFSSDNGASWTIRNNGLPSAICKTIEKNSRGDLFTCQETGIYKSTNNGLNWNLLSNSGMLTSWTLYIDRNDYLYGCKWSKGVYRSKDGGNSWELLPLNRLQIYCALVDDENNLYAGADNALYVYSESDSSWKISPLYRDLASVSTFAFCSDSIIFASTPLRMWKTTNLGLSWNYVTDEAINHIEKGFNNRIFISPPFLYSDNCGQEWRTSNLTGDAKIFLRFPDELYLGTGSRIYKSTNNGTNWDSLCFPGTPAAYVTIDLTLNALNYIFWVGEGYWGSPWYEWKTITYRSINNGMTFQSIYSNKYVNETSEKLHYLN